MFWVRFASFAAVGVVGTAGHYLVLMVLVEAVGADPLLGSTAGFLVGATINYVLNYHWTFRSDASHWYAAPRFFVIAGSGAGVNAALMLIFLKAWGWHYLLGQVVTTGLVMVFNFLLNNAWTFRTSRE